MIKVDTDVSASGSRLKPKGKRQRQEILKLSKMVITHEGVDKIIMRQIASRCSMELGNLQYYFPTRDDLLEAILADVFQSDAAIYASVSGQGDLSQTIGAMLAYWQGDHGKIYHRILHDRPKHPRFRRLNHRMYKDFYSRLMGVLDEAKPGQTPEQLLTKAKLITSLLDGVGLQYHEGNRAEIKEQARQLAKEITKAAVLIATQ